jgi:hypothetical protein
MVLTDYLSTLPIDPRQDQAGRAINGTSANANATVNTPPGGFRYEFSRNGDLYEIRTMLESTQNFQRATQDGGNNNGGANTPAYFEVGTDLSIL